MNHSPDRYLRWVIVGVVVLSGWFVAFDVGGPFRSVVTMLALLVAPGLAASLSVDSMSADLRLVFATIVSAAIVMAVTTAATLAGSKSVDIVFGIVGLVTISLLLVAGLKRTVSLSGRAVDQNSARQGRVGQTNEDGEGNDGSGRRGHGGNNKRSRTTPPRQ